MIFAVPLSDDNPTVNPPILTFFLIGACVGSFLWQLGHNERFILYAYGMIPAELFGLWHPPRNYQVLAPWVEKPGISRSVTSVYAPPISGSAPRLTPVCSSKARLPSSP